MLIALLEKGGTHRARIEQAGDGLRCHGNLTHGWLPASPKQIRKLSFRQRLVHEPNRSSRPPCSFRQALKGACPKQTIGGDVAVLDIGDKSRLNPRSLRLPNG